MVLTKILAKKGFKSKYRILEMLAYPLRPVRASLGKEYVLFKGATPYFTDNSKYLFLYMLMNGFVKKINGYWLAENSKTYNELHEKRMPVVYSGPKIFLKTRMVISSTLKSRLEIALGISHFSLWHGIPLKTILWLDKKAKEFYVSGVMKPVIRFLFFYVLNLADYVLVPSEGLKNIFAKAFQIMSEESLIIAPYPRNIVFLYDRIPGEEVNAIDLKIPSGYNTILFVPTFREYGGLTIPFKIEDYKRLNKFCEREKILFLIKLHPVDHDIFATIIKKIRKLNLVNLVFLDPLKDIYPLLRHVDLLVTDYSSIAYDFLYTGRPMIFYTWDLHRYKSEKGFVLDFKKFTPGPKVYNFDQFIDEIKKILIEDIDRYKNSRKIVGKILWQENFVLSKMKYDALCKKIISLAEF